MSYPEGLTVRCLGCKPRWPRPSFLDYVGRLPEDVTEDFRSSGTSHLLTISGLHVGTILALTLAAGAWMMGRRRQSYMLLPLAAIWLYALLSGLSPSAERAAIMGSIYLLGMALGRPKGILPALGLAAVMASTPTCSSRCPSS